MSPPRMIFYPKEVTDQLPPKTAGVSFSAIWGFWARFAAKQFNHQLTDLYSYVFQNQYLEVYVAGSVIAITHYLLSWLDF